MRASSDLDVEQRRAPVPGEAAPRRGIGPGKRTRSIEAVPAGGPSSGALPGKADGMAAGAGRVVDDWEMTPGLASALGLGAPGDSDDAPEGAARVQRKAVSMPSWASTGQVQARGDLHGENTVAIAERGVASASSPLPHLDAIQRSFGKHDVSNVRAQIGGEAADASRAIGAEAYATGNRVAFSKPPDLHTAAHEAAHVVQQRGGVSLERGVGAVNDEHERHADAVAQRAVAGESSESLLTGHVGLSTREVSGVQLTPDGSPAVGAAPESGSSKQASDTVNSVEVLVGYLRTPDPVAGVGDYVGAFRFLNGLSMAHMLTTISGAAARGYLSLFFDNFAAAAEFDRPRLMSALYAVNFARSAASAIDKEQIKLASGAIDKIPQDQQLQVFEFLLGQRGSQVAAAMLMEGVVALIESEVTARGQDSEQLSDQETEAISSGAVDTAGPAAIEPRPWDPERGKTGGLYIGQEAHKGIAETYRLAHPTDLVQDNSIPMSSLLKRLARMGHTVDAEALSKKDLGLKPDIANLSRLHLYEIKPHASQKVGAIEARMYMGLFHQAGIGMTLGPTNEPGTAGAIPAPNGAYIFWSPEAGVIVYKYRQGRLVLQPYEAFEKEPERKRKSRVRVRLQPLTAKQQQEMNLAATELTIGGMMLYMIIVLGQPILG